MRDQQYLEQRSEQSASKAADILTHYFTELRPFGDRTPPQDMPAEIEQAVEHIVNAAADRVAAQFIAQAAGGRVAFIAHGASGATGTVAPGGGGGGQPQGGNASGTSGGAGRGGHNGPGINDVGSVQVSPPVRPVISRPNVIDLGGNGE